MESSEHGSTASAERQAYELITRDDRLQLLHLCEEFPELLNGGLLHDAIRRDRLAIASSLLSLGASVESYDYLEQTPLGVAASYSRVELTQLLLSHGARPDGTLIAPSTPLMSAVAQGALEIAALLVNAGADVDRDSLYGVGTALSIAEDPPPMTREQRESFEKIAEYLISVGATKPWDYQRANTFWEGAVGELTVHFVESCLGLVHAVPVADERTDHSRVVVRRARHGWKAIFQTVFSTGLPLQGGCCEVGLCLTSKWPLHRRALEEERFRRPVDFVAGVSQRVLAGVELRHGDVLDREHPAVRGLAWPGDHQQWLVVRHESFETRRREIQDPSLAVVLLLVPHLDKKPLKPGADALARANAKAAVKWEKPAASGARNNLVVPLCYDAPWLSGRWY